MVPFEAEKFEPYMKTVVRPWLQDHVEDGQFPGWDGKLIHFYRAKNPSPKGIIVMLHGFCGFFGKYHEVLYNFYEEGYSIYFLELRGHGLSYRPVSSPSMVDVGDFDEYVEDLKSFLDTIVIPDQTETSDLPDYTALPLFLYDHSMGGCIATLFLEKYPDIFQAAVLSSPMIDINFGSTPRWKVNLTALGTKLLGWNDRYVPGQGDFDGKPYFEESGASCRERYDYSFRLRLAPESQGANTMNGSSCRWARASLRAIRRLWKDKSSLTMPLLILQAGKDTYVDNQAENRLRNEVRNALLIRFPEAKHEIFNSEGKTLEKYYKVIFRFLDQYADA